MTAKELFNQLTDLILSGNINPDTLIVVRSEEFDPDPDVECIYYDEEADRLCIGIE